MTQPGLSVWMWGPIMWSIFHTLAYQCDVLKVYQANEIKEFFIYIQDLLPCRYCRDSYGGTEEEKLKARKEIAGFVLDVQNERKETIEEAFQNKHMVAFVYDLHNKVNTKLAKQQWKEMVKMIQKQYIHNSNIIDILNSPYLEADAVNILDKRPTIMTLYKRNEFYQREPINLEGLMLLTVHLFKRHPQSINFRIYFQTVQKILKNIDDTQAQLLYLYLEAINNNLTLDTLQTAFYKFTNPPSNITEKEFLQNLQFRLDLMLASACGAGTCK